ncbi:hypothetical protein [Sandaracinus amylolyticus]|uniref:Uncharacterized protein n=1 Tax=Sandaracinus amylolyticus TaxID=927083 RepID=A0A0F6VZL6_9BACT|nr:hypothetical protein [Sandaracinus amylolyticus]AKF03648.1 hypothetical protein DB32_000797 [Sandaracinus amylolyticus]
MATELCPTLATPNAENADVYPLGQVMQGVEEGVRLAVAPFGR